MDFSETLQYLYSSLPVYQRVGSAAYKANLDNTYALDNYFGHPHREFISVHIAGTNGKGSVSHMIASILAEAGYITGLYTSPHLREFTERIKVNGRPVERDYVVDFVKHNRDMIERLKPSFFEMTVAMAFDYFARRKVEVAVIETGMGGRLDSTNIITPLLAIITNIGLDHTQFLGPDLPTIAVEKAGIIKEGIPVVIGESQMETSPVFIDAAKRKNAAISFADKRYRAKLGMPDYRKGIVMAGIFRDNKPVFENIEFPLPGRYQERNLQTVMQSVEIMEPLLTISGDHIRNGLKNVIRNTSLEGRWQLVQDNPLVICDTAHNSEGLRIVLEQLGELEYKTRRFVIGFVDDKDVKSVLELFPRDSVYYLTRSSVPRSMDENKLGAMATLSGLKGKIFSSVKEAYGAALTDSDPGDLVFVGGSTFIVADLLDLVG
jgi:dihydrofolate synthase/folylpolyglutamate synthase